MALNENVQWLYDNLKSKGIDLGTPDEFNTALGSDKETQDWAYNKGVEYGFDLGSQDEFLSGMGITQTEESAQQPVQQEKPLNPSVKENPAPTSEEEYQENRRLQDELSGATDDLNRPFAQPMDDKAHYSMMTQDAERMRRNAEQMSQRVAQASTIPQPSLSLGPKDGSIGAAFQRQNQQKLHELRKQDVAKNMLGETADKLGAAQRADREKWMAQGENMTPTQKSYLAQAYKENPYLAAANSVLYGAEVRMQDAKRQDGISWKNIGEGLVSFGKDTGKHLLTKLEGMASFGMSDVRNAVYQREVLKKVADADAFDNPETVLTPEQKILYDATITNIAVEIARQNDTSRWSKAGQITADMIPFIEDIMIGNALFRGFGDAGRKAITKGVEKHVKNKLAKWLLKNVGDVAISAGESAATAAIIPHTYSDMLNRSAEVDTDKVGMDGDFRMKLGGIKEQSLGKSWAQAYGNEFKELFTETGGNFRLLGRALIDNPIGQQILKSPLGMVLKRFEGAQGGIGTRFASMTMYHGILGEWLEELEGAIYEGNLKDFFSADTQLPMLLSFAVPAAFTGGLDTTQQAYMKAKYDKAGKTIDKLIDTSSYAGPDKNTLKGQILATLYQTPMENIPEAIGACVEQVYPEEYKALMEGAPEKGNKAAELAYAFKEYLASGTVLTAFDPDMLGGQIADVQAHRQQLRQQADQKAQEEVESISHADGNIYRVGIKGRDNAEGYAKSGALNIEQDENGLKAIGRDLVTVKMTDGTVEQVPADELTIIDEPTSAQDRLQAISDHLFAQYANNDVFRIGDKVYLTKDGQRIIPESSTITGIDDEGVHVESIDEQGQPQDMVIPHEQAAEMLAVAEGETEDGIVTFNMPDSPEMRLRQVGDGVYETIEPVDGQMFTFTDEDLANMGATRVDMQQPETLEEAAQTEEQQPQQPSYPTDETGNPAWNEIEQGQAAQLLYDRYKGNKAKAVAVADDMLKEAEKVQKQAAKQQSHKLNLDERDAENEQFDQMRKAANAAVDYWHNVKLSLNKITTAEEQATKEAQQQAMMQAREERSKTEEGKVTGTTMAERYNAAQKIIGNAGTTTLPDGRELAGHYILISPEGVTSSHDAVDNFKRSEGYPVTSNGQSINDRDYTNDKEEQQKVIAIAQNFNGNSIKNMPVISDEGMVYNGNGRMMAGQLAANNNTDAAYMQSLAANAAQFGFTPEQVASIPHARVAFQLDERLPYSTQSLAIFNEQETQTQSNTGKAAGYARKLTPQAISEVLAAVDGFNTIDAFFSDPKAPHNLINSLINAGIIAQREKAEMVDGEKLSATGKERLSNILFGTVFDNDTIRLMGDDAALKNSIMRALPQILDNKSLGEFSLEANINDAIRLLYEVRKAKVPFKSFVSQTVMSEDGQVHTAAEDYSPYQLLLAEEMTDGGVDAFRDALTLYNDQARTAIGGQMDIFNNIQTPTELKNLILQRYGKEPNETERAAQTSPEASNAVQRTPASNEQAAEQITLTDGRVVTPATVSRADFAKLGNISPIQRAVIAIKANKAQHPDWGLTTAGFGNDARMLLFNELPSGKNDLKKVEDIYWKTQQEYVAEPNKTEEYRVAADDVLREIWRRLTYLNSDKWPGGQGSALISRLKDAELAVAEYETDTNPSEAQKKAENYKQGHVTLWGLPITIENPKGSTRRGTNEKGKKWSQLMHNTYGKIRRTEGVDGDHIDVFLGPNLSSERVFVVDQLNVNTKEFDEHKVMLGFDSMDEAQAAYLSNYEKGWQGMGPVTEVTMDEFKKWIDSSHRKTKPFSEYKGVKKEGSGSGEQTQETQTKEAPVASKVKDDEKLRDELAEELRKYDEGETSPEDEALLYDTDDLRNAVKELLDKYVSVELADAWLKVKEAGAKISQAKNNNEYLAAAYNFEDEEEAFVKFVRDFVGDKAKAKSRELTLLEEAQQRQRLALQGKAVSKMSNEEILAELEKYADGSLFEMTPKMAKRIQTLAKKYGKGLPEPIENMVSNAKLLTNLNKKAYEKPAEEPTKPAEQPKAEPVNTIFTDDAYEAAKARMKARLNRLNMGLDPEMLADQIVIAGYHVERGARKFADFARAVIKDFGDGIRKYARQMYNYLRDIPEGDPFRAEMDDYQTVMAFDIDNFDYKDRMMPTVREYEDVNGQKITIDDVSKGRDGTDYYDLTITEPSGHQRQTNLSIADFNKELESKGIYPATSEVQNAENAQKNEKSSQNILINQNNFVPLQQNEKRYEADDLSVVVNTQDYKTYLTQQAKEVFARLGQKERKPHKRPELSYISFASRDGVMIPLEVLKSDPAIIEAQAKIDSITDSLELTQEQIEEYANRLLEGGDIKQERKAFIVIGRPAGGKSSVFAEPLAEKNAARIIDSDDVKPWLDGYDNGDGAGYVQKASDAVMQEALWRAALNGDNVVIPKIGGGSVIDEIVLPLKELGYTVELYYNEVAPESSYMRAMARFAEKGRYLSLNYLEGIGDKATKTFNNFSTKDIYGTISELSSQKVQDLRGRLGRIREMEARLLSERLGQGGRSISTLGISELLEQGESSRGRDSQLAGTPLFDHYEWKNNDVPFGAQPKTIKQGDNKPTPPAGPNGGKKATFEKGQKVKYKNKVDGKLYDATIDSVNADGTYNIISPSPVFGDIFMGNISEDRIRPIEEPRTESPMQKQFRDIKAQYPDAVLLFRHGDFYELYDTDAEEGSKILGVTLTKNHWAKMAGFPFHQLDVMLPKLVRAGKRVAICDVLEEPKPTAKRGVTELLTPGTPYQGNEPREPKKKEPNPEAYMQHRYTLKDWEVAGLFGAREGQRVEDEVVDFFREQLPPIYENNSVFQEGEPHSHDDKGVALYHTFERDADNYWVYKGVQPQRQNVEKTASEPVKQVITDTIGEITESKHTKTGATIYVVKPLERVGNDEFKVLKRRAKENNGYYSSFVKGFVFNSTNDATRFNNISDEQTTTEQTSADTEAVISTAEATAAEASSITRTEPDDRPEEEQGVEVITPEEEPSEEEVIQHQETIDKVDAAIEKVDKQLAILGYYEADTNDPTKFHESYGYMKTAEAKALKDIDKLAKQIADDLGIEINKRQKIASASIAPAGGDISFSLPLNNNGRVLYVNIDLTPNESWRSNYNSDGSEYDLVADGLMWRVEETKEKGFGRYRISNQIYREGPEGFKLKYEALLNDIRRQAKEYLPQAQQVEVPAGTTVLEAAKARQETTKKKKSDKNRIPDGQQVLDLFADVVDEINDGIHAEDVTPPLEEQTQPEPEEHNGFKVGDKVLFRSKASTKRKPEVVEIVSFEKDGRPVLNSFGTSYITEIADWDDIEHINNEDNGTVRNDGRRKSRTERTEPTGQSANQNGAVGEGQQQKDERPESGRVDSDSSQSRVHDGERSRGTVLQSAEQDVTPKERKNTHNFRYDPNDPAPTSNKARYDANIAAIKLLKRLQEEGRQATPEEQRVLAKFTGWGGLGEYFKGEPGTTYYASYGEKSPYQIIKELLTDDELEAAQLSRNSAYYTPASVIDQMWAIAKKLGFKGGNILEGSAGIGNILSQMPQSISDRSNIQAVEIDDITAGILAQLYPDATTYAAGFQEVDLPNNSQDLVITNVPFVTGQRVYDKKEKDLSRRFHNIHDFCIAKNIRKLRQGGLGIFITSSGTLDNSKDLRRWIINEGDTDVIGAFRMNRETFGGTSATSDIIVVRKRVNGQKAPNPIDVLDTETARIAQVPQEDVWDSKKGGWTKTEAESKKLVYNKYFVEHPLNMGGEMGFGFEHGDTRWGGTTAGCYPVAAINQEQRMQDWIDGLESTVHVPSYEELEQGAVVQSGTYETYEGAVPYGSLILNSKGEICRAYHGSAVPVEGINPTKVKGHTKAEVLKDYNDIKSVVEELLSEEAKGISDETLKPLLKKLNKVYDDFVKKYGNFNRNVSLSFLRNDVQWANIAALENVKEKVDTNGKVRVEISKTDVFSKRVVGVTPEPKAENAKDGIILSMQQYGHVRPDMIAIWLGKSQEEVEKEIIDSRLAFFDPQTDNMVVSYEYLSGNVREKLAYAEEHNENGKYNTNIEELRKVIPMDIPAHLIEFNIGSTWIPVELYHEYLKEKYDVENLKLVHIGSSWISKELGYYGVYNEKNRSEGVYSKTLNEQVYGHQLMIAAMNNVPVVVSKTYKHSDGSTETVTDKDASAICSDKIGQIKDDFVDWARSKMQKDSELAERIQKIYNDRFNAIVPMLRVDKAFLSPHLPGQNHDYTLYDHQQQAVVRATTQPIMLAHEVGTGKTITLISSAMEMRRLGTSKKPMIVVQNSTTPQFVKEAKDLYPNAKILTVSERDRTKEGRQEFYAKIKYNDWDLIIIPQPVFDMIPDSETRMRDFINEKIEEKIHAIEAAKEAKVDKKVTDRMERELKALREDLETNNMSGKRSSKKNAEKDAKKEAERRATAEAQAQEMLDRRTDEVEDFDDMGIDALLIDEAHNYKHLGFSTMMARGVKGIDPSYSKRAAALYLKCQAVYERCGHKNVVFATGTPISNTAAEIWTFMKYLMPKEVLKENDIYYFDDFVHNFGKISEMLEFTTSGKFKANNRFAQYGNVPELMRLWLTCADCVLTREVGQVNDKVPEVEDGKAKDIFLPQSPSLIDIMAAVRAELQRYEEMDGKEKKENSHIPLTMYGVAKRAAIDPRLVDENAADEPLSKTNKAVEETLRSLQETKKYNGTVAIFCDSYQNKMSGFNLFDDIKAKLVKAGVPAAKVAIIRSEMTDNAKQKIFDAVREGEIRVIMGSTQTLGTGVNIQTRLHTLIHMDAPDRPMDYTQRNGRIVRQGNMHRAWNIPVRVLRFGVEDSLDVTSYQRLKTKAGFIDSIMNGKSMIDNNLENRVLEDAEEGIFDNPVAMLSGSQYALLKSQAERDLRKWEARKKQHEIEQTIIANKLKDNARIIEHRRELISTDEKFLEQLKQALPDGKVTEYNINGTICHTEKELKDAIKAVSDKIQETSDTLRKRGYEGEERNITLTFTFNGLPFHVKVWLAYRSSWDEGQRKISIVKEVHYNTPTSDTWNASPSKLIDKLVEHIEQSYLSGAAAQGEINYSRTYIERLQKENELMKEREGKSFEYSEELNKARALVDDYTKKMQEELKEKEAKYANQASSRKVNLTEQEDEDETTPEAQIGEMPQYVNITEAQELATSALIEALNNNTDLDVFLATDEEAAIITGDDNAEFNIAFNNFIDRFKKQLLKRYESLTIGLTAGMRNYLNNGNQLLMNQSVLTKAKNKHNINIDSLRDLPEKLSFPIAVFKSARPDVKGKVVLIEVKDNDNHNIVVSVNMEATQNGIEVNEISSIYGRENFMDFARWTDKGLLEYGDIEKFKAWYASLPEYNSQGESKTALEKIGAKLQQISESTKFLSEKSANNSEIPEFSIRKEPAPKKTGIGYKVFYRGKDGKLYPPMVANQNGEATPVGVWLNADAAPVAGVSKTGRPQVKAGGKGTQGGSGQLAYRPGWHLGEIPYALQFNRKDENGEKTLFPKDFVWAEVEYAADKDYQEEAMKEGMNASGKFQHSLAGLKRVPTDGFYRYRTNPNPATDPWIITGAMKVNRILTNEEVDEIVRAAGREPQVREMLVTSNGTIYGWAVGDRIYLTKTGLNPNTPIHEYTHLWAKAMRRNNPEGWQSIVNIFKDTPMWQEVVEDSNYSGLQTPDAICSEVLARYSGTRGAARMEEAADEMLHEAQQDGSVLALAKARQLISRVKKALSDFWHWVGTNLFDIKHFDSAEQVADRVLFDLLNQTELGNLTGESTEAMVSKYTPEQLKFIQDWNAAHPRPTYNYGETLKAYEQRLNNWESERERYRNQLKNWNPMPSEADKVDNPESAGVPAFVPGVRPTPMANETPSEYALRLKQYYQLMRDENMVADYVAEINAQADATAKVLKKNTLVRGLLDAAKPIENFQEWMTERGAKITNDSNAYTDTFLATGRVTQANEQMERDIIRPLAQQIGKIIAPDKTTGKSRLDGLDIVWQNMDVKGTGTKLDGKELTPREIIGVYCQAKDCAEAIELGLPDRGAAGFENNIGMTHNNLISAVESIIPAAELDKMWELIRKATHYALEYDHKSGRISDDTFEEFSKREFYVPQRGWRERDESGLVSEYEPVGKRGNDPYNAALVKARGRKTLASDPFAYIMSIDASSIISSENNKIKQKFLQFCLDNENLGLKTGAFRVKKYWIMNVIDEQTGKIKLDEEGNPMMVVSYVAPSEADFEHDRNVKELIKKRRKELAKVNRAYIERQSHAELTPQLEEAYKSKIAEIEQNIEDLGQTMRIAWHATNSNISQRTSDEKKQHEVRVLMDGQEYVIELQDEKLANAINKKFKQHQEELFNTTSQMRNATRFMSAMLTQFNPEFAASNFARDYQVAVATLMAEHRELVLPFVKNFALCQPAVWTYAFNDKVRNRENFRNSELGQYLKEYFEAGAATGFSYMQDLKSLRRDFDAMINESNLRRGLKGAVGLFSMLTEVSETSVRFAGYVSARQNGMGINEAAYLSKELTTNFDRAGEIADTGWMSWFSFFRATLNGNIKFLKALKKMPLAYSLIAASYFAMGMANQFLNPDDPDDEIWASDYTRQSNFVIWKFRVPTAHFLRMFFAAGVNAAKWISNEKSFGEATYNTATFATQELLPNYLNLLGNGTEWNSREGRVDFTWEGLLQGVMPSPVSPIADVYFNRDFRGATINREPFAKSEVGTKDILLAKENTLPVYKWLTQAIYEGTGGSMTTKYQSSDPTWRSWLFDTSASSVEHVVEGYMPAGMDMFITAAEAIYDAATGTPTGPDKWPFVRKFYNAYTPERAYMQQYYLLNGRIKEFERNMQDYQKNDKTRYNMLRNSQEYRTYIATKKLVGHEKEAPTTEDVKALREANMKWLKK